MTPVTVADDEPFFEGLKLLRLTSTTALAPPTSVFCCAAVANDPTTRFIVDVSVAVPPLSANNAANGKDAPGALTLFPNTVAFVVVLPSLFCRWMPALPQLVIVLFWIRTVAVPDPAQRTKIPS